MSKKRGREQFSKYQKLLNTLATMYKLLPLKMRVHALERHRNTSGKFGLGLRYAILKAIAHTCGDNVAIFQGVYLLNPQNLQIGNNVSIQPMCYIECGNDGIGVVIGNDVSIAHGATIMATTHTFSTKDVCIKEQPVEIKPVQIQHNVWIGAKATILAGITVYAGGIIGANAVVTKATEENKIYAGVPARVIKEC